MEEFMWKTVRKNRKLKKIAAGLWMGTAAIGIENYEAI